METPIDLDDDWGYPHGLGTPPYFCKEKATLSGEDVRPYICCIQCDVILVLFPWHPKDLEEGKSREFGLTNEKWTDFVKEYDTVQLWACRQTRTLTRNWDIRQSFFENKGLYRVLYTPND